MERQSLFTFCVVLAMIFGFANVSPALAAYPLTDLDALGISDNDTQVWSLKQLNPSYIAPPAYEPTLIPDLDRQRTSGASAATDLVNWSVLVLIYPNTDADFEDAQGNPQHFSGSLTSTEINRSLDIVDNFSWLVQDWSAGMASVSLTVHVVTDQAIKNVTLLPKGPPDPQKPSYWVEPSDAGPRLSNELASGSYDSVYILWNPGWDGKDTVIPTGYAGRSHVLPIDEGGFTFTYATGVYLPYDYYYPGEVMVHEWLHGVGGYYRSLGYQVADSDEGDDFGYTQDANGSLAPFYRALMQGNLVTPYKEHSGISDAVWRAGNLRAVNRPLPAQLLSPVYGSYVNLTPQLKWAATDMDYTYLVDVFDVADPITPVYSTATTGNTLGIPDGILTWGKSYEWTVRSTRNDVQAPASAPLRFEAPAYVISGNTGVGGVILSYIDGTPKTVTSDGSGNYSIPVPHNWSGTVTPSLAGYTFTPESRTYLQLAADQTAQNYYTTPGTWQTVGAAGFSADAAYKLTLAVENGIPYVAYPDKSVDWKATVKKFDGSNWVTVGVPGFSLGGFYAIEEPISIVVDDGTPYVAYQDHHMGDRITVMKFDGSRWVALQRPGFSTGDYVTNIHLAVDHGTPYIAYIDYPHTGGRINMVQKFKNGAWETVGAGFTPYVGTIYSLAIQNGTPYVAIQDLSDVNTQRKVGVMKFDAPTGNWIPLGSAVFTEDDPIINYVTASFAWDNCTPYASYRNGFAGDKATVKKFSGTDWVTVGPAAFSTVEVSRTSLALDHSTPLVAYDGLYNPYKATVMKFDGSNWITVGPADLSADAASYVSLSLDNGKPFVAFMDWSNGGKATVMKFVGAPGVPDITPPGVDSFTVDPLSASLAIPIKVFTASDSVGVTGYMITEIPIAPEVDDPGWSDTAPSTYSVERSGSYTLYPWAKDAAGHVSALFCSPAAVKVDATRPTVDSFTATSPSSSFDIPITAFTASDDTGVTGYKITLSSTAPAAGDPGWSATAPTTFRVGAEGNYTLYPWAKDTAGNVSARYGSPATVQVDLPPYVVSFIVASPASSLDIPIIQFTASDTYGVSGYLITESPTPPAAGDPGWFATAPTTYQVGAEGNYTLYPWAKDTAGNVSDVYDPTPVSVVIHVPVTLIVTNNADRGTGSLRQAIAESSPGDRITFDPSLAGATITLDSTLTIDKSLTIDGSSLASPVTISGADAHRVFYIGGELSSIIVTLDSLTISHGYLSEDGGAGIANEGALNVTNSSLSENSAGSGGAIYNTGILNVTNSTFSGNSAIENGGGIYNYGAVSVTNSTFSGNSAIENGGGIYNYGAMSVTNSTFSGNSAHENGGGIFNAYWGTLNYSNTIVANSALGDDIVDLGSSSSKNNLIGTIALGALADNGGPTQTIALPAGSPAIDAGDNAICAAAPVNGLDQRGVARDAFCDIGAYEYIGSPDTLAPTVDLFTATSPSSSLDIPITAFTASDDTGVTGYLITQSSTAPAADDAGWSGTAPTTYSVDEDGSYILYPWAKDAAGNVSALFGSPASVAVDSAPLTVDAGSYHVDEAASVTVTASGHDQGNGPLTYAWDLDNDGSFETPGQSVTFSAANLDGPSTYTIQVQVTDKRGLTASDQADVDVLNVASTANLTVTPDNLFQGGSAMLAFSNPFDPGVADTAAGFYYSYDCTNDGVFELAGAPDASYSCVVPVAGVVTALGRIEDKDGGFTDYTAQVTVLTPLEGIEGLNVQIRDLVSRGVLSDVQGRALSKKLKAASWHLDRDKTRTAINRLHSFTNQVKAMVRRRVLSPTEGQPLIDAANGIIAALRSVARDR